jgi:succinoglycan biosynthesis protein ExoM
MTDVIAISICVATCRRPDGLLRLMDSINSQILPDNVSLKIIIVDNDPNASADLAHQSFAATMKWPSEYIWEPNPGVSFARNTAIDHVDTQYCAFIDDDEYACPNWISSHLLVAERTNADAVFGPVHYQLPHGAPQWMSSIVTFRPAANADGASLAFGATNNVLIKMPIIRQLGIKFSEQYALTGGEDTEYFSRLAELGGKLIWNKEAVVYETVEIGRANLRWIVLRGYQGGQNFARIFFLCSSRWRRSVVAINRIMLIPLAILFIIILYPFSKPQSVNLIHKVAGWVGQIAILAGRSKYYEAYGDAT